jgi:phosphatidylserine/phosphatidylglycerophosphate/cardiolipin synthase-like enzyme
MKKYLTILHFTFYIFIFPVHSQSIKAYFTKSVDNSASLITDAQYSSHLEDTIVQMIDETQNTLDIAVWDNGSTKIITALNNAYTRGVVVRYITSDNALNSALSGLSSNIEVLQRDATLTSNVMHNKFIISDNARILSGSMNFGLGSMEDDYNNIILIEDVAVASNYLIEFNEMWGSTTAIPNLTNSKFGPDKTDNTTHNFTIGISGVELYFSPTDLTTSHIISSISSADYTCFVSMFTLNQNDIGDALIAAKNAGVDVRVIMENSSYPGTEYNNLLNAGIPVISHESIQFDFHHKYAVIDAAYQSSDPMVITGSHNWTSSAEEEYDENTLIIHDGIIAGQYLEEFTQRWNELNPNSVSEVNEMDILVFPTITSNQLFVQNNEYENLNYEIIDLNGKQISNGIFSEKLNSIDVSSLEKGMYFLILKSSTKSKMLKWVKD